MAVAVLADATVTARRMAALLAAAGVPVELGADAPRPREGRRLLLLTLACDASERVDRIAGAAAEHPGAPVVAAMPEHAGTSMLRRALRAGADGIVLDGQLDRTLLPTLRAVWAGQLVLPPSLGRKIARRHLSHREKQILSLVMVGMTNREIAQKLFLAESTIKTHLASTFRKLDARSRAEAVARITDSENGYGTGILAVDEAAAA